ncbi:hypothetical protein Q9R19_08310 [Microbacterium sp. ARD32]|uniref:hypothetical protein n=1 Tax=Microbacterium sp. ARD32 TaxID=2962577 RepID=UPI002880DFBB|nr:hypothetical protein [Microbacterium sp. ARD32]MDT0157622.1 hypothetical protein [Microbacterium sp. ARD32]
MSDPTPFPTDPLEPEGIDPDLSKDDPRQQSTGTDEERPDDHVPTFDERQQARTAALDQNHDEEYPPIA